MSDRETRKPVQAGDYGKDAVPRKDGQEKKPEGKGKTETDGQKTLSLWGKSSS